MFLTKRSGFCVSPEAKMPKVELENNESYKFNKVSLQLKVAFS